MIIFIIIPVHNRIRFTRECLESLNQQDSRQFRVIVVDDGSIDGTSDMISKEFPETILLNGDGNLWWIGAVNKGIRHALNLSNPEDLILLLNDDLIVRRNYISSMIDAAQSNPGAIIGSVETTMTSPEIIKNGGIQVNWSTAKRKVLNPGRQLDEFPQGYTIEVSKLTGRGTLFPLRVFRDLGLYDEAHFRHCGDPELPLRAKFKAGYTLLVNYDAVVISRVAEKKNINTKEHYTLSDWKEYFFGIRSHFNIMDHYWLARNSAPNYFWFIRYFSLEIVRIIGHYFLRLKILHT